MTEPAATDGGKRGGVLRARIQRTTSPPAAAAHAPVSPPPPPSIERIAATAAARAARRAAGLSATAEAVATHGMTLSELPELLPERALIAVVEAGGERLGVAALCPAVLASLIEMQAIGRVTARAVDPRRPTRADAALAAEFVNHLLEELGDSLAGLPGQRALAGYRYASHLDDPRPLALMLEDTGYRALRIDLRLGAGGERRGVLFVAVPATPAGTAPEAPASTAAEGGAAALAAPARGAAPSFAAALRHAPVPVAGVLCRRQISLRELRSLKPGATIALPRAALDGAWLETLRGQRLARAKLGEADGFHALRLRHREAPADAGNPAAPKITGPLPQGAASRQQAPTVAAATIEPPIADLGAPDAFRPIPSDPQPAPQTLPLAVS